MILLPNFTERSLGFCCIYCYNLNEPRCLSPCLLRNVLAHPRRFSLPDPGCFVDPFARSDTIELH